jgi:hypothetical protein
MADSSRTSWLSPTNEAADSCLSLELFFNLFTPLGSHVEVDSACCSSNGNNTDNDACGDASLVGP